MAFRKCVDDTLGKDTVLRFIATSERYLKVFVGDAVYIVKKLQGRNCKYNS